MPLPIELGITALESIKRNAPKKIMTPEHSAAFENVIGVPYEEFYQTTLRTFISILEAIKEGPDIEEFTKVTASVDKFEKVLKQEKNNLKNVRKEDSLFISLLESPYNIVKSYVDDYRLKNFN